MYPRSRAFELRTPQAPWRSEWAAEHAAPGTCVRFSEQVAKLKAQATGLDWPYEVGVWVCAGAGSRWQRCCAGPPALPLPRRSQGLPLAGYFSAACASGFHGTKVPSAARTDKHGRAFLGEKTLQFFFCDSLKLGIKAEQKCLFQCVKSLLVPGQHSWLCMATSGFQ